MPEWSKAEETRRDSTGGSEADQQMEQMMGVLLRTGVLAAATTVLAGGGVYLARHGREKVAYSVFHARPLSVDHPLRLMGELQRAGPEALVYIGILILVATPVLRVALGLVSFVQERDRLYVLVSAVVLAALLCGMFLGR